MQLPAQVALVIILVIPIGTAIVLRQIATQRGSFQTFGETPGLFQDMLRGVVR